MGQNQKEIVVPIQKKDEELQVVYGVVYAPFEVDTDGEAMDAKAVREMAWDFLASGKAQNIDTNHDLVPNGSVVVESFLARKGDPDFPENSWVLGVLCSDQVWKLVKTGELNGFSFYGTSRKHPATVLVEVTKQLTGVTASSTEDSPIPPHDHTFIVNFNNKGQIVSGRTDFVQGHSHSITKGTATDPELDHAHRIVLE